MTRAFRPRSLDEALRVLADPELGAVPVAGCTDLMVADSATGREHAAVVDLLGLSELCGIRETDEHLDLGAAVTFTALRHDELVRRHLPILAEAAATIGGWQIQNRATIGGNVANASPAGDSLPVLLALEAELLLVGPTGERRVPYAAMHTGYRETALSPGEVIARIRVPKPAPETFQAYRKVGTREAQAISKVVVACVASRAEGLLTDVRLASGSVAPVPVRLTAAERACEGRAPDRALAGEAALAARAAVRPIDDVRSTARYRSFVLGRVVQRLVLCARN